MYVYIQYDLLHCDLPHVGGSSKPYRDFGEFLLGVVQWKTPSLSLVVFLVSLIVEC